MHPVGDAAPPLVVALDQVGTDLNAERTVLDPLGITIVAATDSTARRHHLRDAAGLLANRTRIGAELLDQAPSCRCVVTYGVGFDHVDLVAAAERGVAVCNVADYCSEEVADHTLTLMLAVLRRAVRADSIVRQGGWGIAELGPIHRLRGLTVGLVGYGRIGQAVHRRLSPFGFRVRVFDPLIDQSQRAEVGAAVSTALPTLLEQSDVVSLHLPLNNETQNMIDARALAAVKPGAVLINTSRGGLVNTAAMLAALDAGRLSGAGLDVFSEEPPAGRLLARPDIVLTPHMAFYSLESIEQLKRTAAETMAHALVDATASVRIV